MEKTTHTDEEHIHMPDPSIVPLVFAVGFVLFMLGLVLWPFTPVVLIIGIGITGVALWLWIRDSIRDYKHLPEE